MLLACCLVLVQCAVALTVKQPVMWLLAVADICLAAGLWRGVGWVRWVAFARCAGLLVTVGALKLTGARFGVSWPPLLVAVLGSVVPWLPSSRRWFGRKGAS